MAKGSNSFLGRGWAFPIRPGTDGKLQLTNSDDGIRNSIFLILSTAPGERLMLPDFGCGVHDLVFQSNTVALRGLVQSQVQSALVQWEPRIDVLDVTVTTNPKATNQLIITIDYRIRANNTVYNLVYPFYLQEGAG